MRMIYDEQLAQAAYLIGCQRTGEAIIIDPERDVDRYIEIAQKNDLQIVAVAETHIHADFVSGARELAERIDAKVYLSGEGGPDWQYQWLNSKRSGGAYTHQLLKDQDSFHIGNIQFTVLHTPGHTPEHISYLITDQGAGADEPIALASGDFVFVGDLGRPDLLETAAGTTGAMEPAAKQLYKTLAKLDNIPDFVQVWPGHGAGSACGKALGAVPMSTIGYEKRFNDSIKHSSSEQSFVEYILQGQPEPPLYFSHMKRINKEGPSCLGSIPDPKQITAQELRELDQTKITLVDTRDWHHFRNAHVPGSLSLPIENAFSTNAGSFITPHEPLCLIIDPQHKEQAIRELIRIGIDNIHYWFDSAELDQYESANHPFSIIQEASASQSAELIHNPDIQPLDVRKSVEFAVSNIPGAINIAHTRLASRTKELPKDKTLLINCLSGMRSARSAAYLQREGFKVINLVGGITAWEQEINTQP
ncbi:MAG: rhodanese-like domain-containing protein [Phycisphaerales bacterium]